MPNPVSVVEVIVPTPSAWLESLKTLRTSICELSGACARDLEQRRVRLTRELDAVAQRAVGAVGPPSTASGPRSFESTCVETGKTLTLSRPGGSVYAVSATSSIRCCSYQAFASAAVPVKVDDRGDPRDGHGRAALNGKRALGRELDLLVLRRVVAADQRDLEVGADRRAGRVQTRTRWPSRKPSASQLELVGPDDWRHAVPALVGGVAVSRRRPVPEARADELADQRPRTAARGGESPSV